MKLIQKEKGLFMYEDDKEIGKAICEYTKDTVDILHVIVKPSMRGKGLAAVLVEQVVTDAKKEGKEVITTCSYAAAWMRENKDLMKNK